MCYFLKKLVAGYLLQAPPPPLGYQMARPYVDFLQFLIKLLFAAYVSRGASFTFKLKMENYFHLKDTLLSEDDNLPE